MHQKKEGLKVILFETNNKTPDSAKLLRVHQAGKGVSPIILVFSSVWQGSLPLSLLLPERTATYSTHNPYKPAERSIRFSQVLCRIDAELPAHRAFGFHLLLK